MPAGINYCTRESVKVALDEIETVRTNRAVDEAIDQGGRDIERLCRVAPLSLAPTLATRTIDFPSSSTRSPSWRLWLPRPGLLEASSVTTRNGATTLTASDYLLRPDEGPPYTRIEIDRGGTAAFDSASTSQRAIGIAGLWGVDNTRKQVGTLASTLAGTASATASLAWTTARFGVGDVLFVDDEAMVIAEKTYVDSGQNLGGTGVAAESSDAVLTVADGTAFAVEEVISIGGERMLITDITGNNLSVRRGEEGTQVAAHANGVDIYALTGVELTRAVLGTTIAAHSSSAAVYRWVVPGDLAALNRAYAISTLLNERSGYARTLQGGGDVAAEISGRSLRKLEQDVYEAYAPKARMRGII